MIKVIHLDDSGAEMATVEIDDFTIETVYAGIADLLRRASVTTAPSAVPTGVSRQERQRREKILTRLHS
jgi:hypothetical protein